MTRDDPSAHEMQARIEGLTHAVAAIVAQLVADGRADERGIMQALDRCEVDLRRMSQPTFASGQAGYLRDEIQSLLPPLRDPFGD